jgi:hypothetical protein
MKTITIRDTNTKAVIAQINLPTDAHELTVSRFLAFIKFEEANRPKFTIHDNEAWIDPEERTPQQYSEWLDFICQQMAQVTGTKIEYFEWADSASVMQLYADFVEMLNVAIVEQIPKTAIVLSDVTHIIPNEDLKDRLNGLTVGQMRELSMVEQAYRGKSSFDINLASLASVLQPVGKGWQPEQYTERLEALKEISLHDFMGLSFFLISRLESCAISSQQFSVAQQIAEIKQKAEKNRAIIKSRIKS